MQKITLIPFHGPNHALLFLFVLILVLNFAGCAHHLKKTPSFEDGQLFLANGTPITLEAFSRQAADVDYILIGETHDAPHHHLMQAKLVEALAHSGMQLAVGFEMLYSRNQDDLKPFNRGEMDVAELEQASNWSVSWGYAFSMYAPIFQVAKRFGLPVYGLNISRETLNQVRAHGFERTRDMVPQKEVPDLPREVIWPMAEQIDAFHTMIELFKQWHPKHTETAGRKTVKTDGEKPPAPMALPAPDPKRFLLVQSLWDTSMAESAVSARYATGRPMVIIAGSGHVKDGQGIAYRLHTLDPGCKTLLVLPVSYPLQEQDDKQKASADVFFASRPGISSLGLIFRPEPTVIIVDEVEKDSRAEAAGIKRHDRIISIEGRKMKTPADFHSTMAIFDLQDRRKGLSEKSKKTLVVERNGKKQDLALH